MSFDIIMPVLGMNQDTGVISEWIKKPGEWVSSGDAVMSVETDKAIQEIETRHEGYLSNVKFEEGAEVPVGEVIAQLTATPQNDVTLPSNESAVSEKKELPTENTAAELPTLKQVATLPATPMRLSLPESGKILASPKAKTLAKERNVSLTDIVSSGIQQPLHVIDVIDFVPSKSGNKTRSKISVKVNPDAFIQLEHWLEEGFEISRVELLAAITTGSLRFTNTIEDDFDCYVSIPGEDICILNPDLVGLSGIEKLAPMPGCIVSLWDFTDSPISSFSDEDSAGINIAYFGESEWTVDLSYDSNVINSKQAVALLSELVLRFVQPLRQLL